VDNLLKCSIRYLAFENGIYEFETGKLLQYPVPGVFFMHKINHKFPTNVDPAVITEVMEKIIIPAFPDKEQQEYYLYRLGRAIAGDVSDKTWHVNFGERNSSKGVLCDLLQNCFGDFVQTILSENLLIKSGGAGGDAAKAQSWMSTLEFKRLAISNEIQLQGNRARLDGNLIKRIASGGDMIGIRRNYQDEEHKRLQTTIMMSCNDLPPIEPVDACLTLQVFEYNTVFQPSYVIEERGDKCPKHWKVADPDIKKVWIQRPDIIDAFTMMVLGAWKPELLKPPAIVIENTKQFNGAAAVSEYDRFAEIVKYDPRNSRDTEFLSDELALILSNAGLKDMTSQKVNMFVRKIH